MKTKKTPFGAVILLLASFVLTAAALYMYEFLPPRVAVVAPGSSLASIYHDRSGETQGEWLDRSQLSQRCTYSESNGSGHFCGINFQMGDGVTSGVDLSMFDSIEVKLDYSGPGDVLRFYIRDYTFGFKDRSDNRATKYINVLRSIRDKPKELIIPLDSMVVAEWWIISSGLDRTAAVPTFRNVVHIGIDTPTPTAPGAHNLRIESLKFVGQYVTKERWYLGILVVWGALLLVITVVRDVRLQAEVHAKTQKLNAAVMTTQELLETSEKYRELSIADPLSGLFNRRGVAQCYEGCFQGDAPVIGAIILMDIDFFKKINDNFGHDVGDLVIEKVAGVLRDTVRANDIVGRWGGEEFIVLCPSTGLDGAKFLAEKIRKEVESYQFEDHPNLTVTLSLGFGEILPELGFEENLKEVDRAMYLAKEAGRNRCVEAKAA